MLACLVTGSAAVAAEPRPCPDDGVVASGLYTNKYFDLSYPLPSGWTQDVAGPGPSASGYYVLATAIPAGELTGTILIAAQDTFFADTALDDVRGAARDFARSISKVAGMTIDRQPSEIAIAGRVFSRVDFSGVGLFRSTLFTESRCHLVSFNFTAKSPELLAALVLNLDKIGDARDAAAARSDPVCIRDRASPQHLLTKVDPAASGPTFTPIPVRLIIGNDGGVKHVHVIRATVEQRNNIEGALAQWKLKPHAIDGRASEIETGLMIEFRSGGAVSYSGGDRR
jgi:hypothetical protein